MLASFRLHLSALVALDAERSAPRCAGGQVSKVDVRRERRSARVYRQDCLTALKSTWGTPP